MDDDSAAITAIVSTWLAKRGYNASKAALQRESGLSLDEYVAEHLSDPSVQNFVLFHENVGSVAARYTESFTALKEWVDKSLDRYKVELMGVLFPLWAHCVLDLLSRGLPDDAAAFLRKFGQAYAADHGEVVNKLKALVALGAAGETALQKLSENADFVALRGQKLAVALSSYAFRLLFMYLLDSKSMLLLGIVNAHVDVRIQSAAPDANGQDLRFYEASASSKVVQWKRQRGPDGPVSALPAPPALPVGVSAAMEADARVAAARPGGGSSLPSIAMFTFFNTHQADLNCVALSDDVSHCVAGLGDSSLRLWDLRDGATWHAKQPGAAAAGRQYWSLVGHSGPVYGASFSPCSRYVLSASEDCTVRLWGVEAACTGALATYRGHNFPVWDVAFSPLGYYFATASHDHTARVFGTDRSFPLRILAGHLGDVDCVAWHPNCNYVATGSADNTIRLWEVNTGECVRIFTGHQGAVYSLAFSPDGATLASGGDDGVVGVWDLGTSKSAAVLRGHSKTVWSVAYNATGTLLASGGGDDRVVVWDMAAALADRRAASAAAAAAAAAGPSGAALPSSLPFNAAAGVAGAGGAQFVAGVFPTKRTPVSAVKFSRRNMLFCAGAAN